MNLWDQGNASDYELEDVIPSTDGHMRTVQRARELLVVRNHQEAADILETTHFNIYEAHNHFNDPFNVLLFEVPLPRYEELRLLRTDAYFKQSLRAISEVFGELGIYIRIIAAQIADELEMVQSPTPTVTMEVVDRALRDAEILLTQSDPVSAVDRVHTALHGYLLAECRKAGIPIEVADPNSARLFGLIREHHPALAQIGPEPRQVTTLVRSMGAIVGALEPLRNRGSVAHPNGELLEPAEARLFINSVRTILHYLAAKLSDE